MFNQAFPQEMSKKMLHRSNQQDEFSVRNTDYIKQYTMPVLREGSEWYIEFYAFDPSLNKLRRKRIKINRIKGIAKRRAYARDVMRRITQQLSDGWNPWLEQDCNNLMKITEVIDSYEAYIDKMYNSGNYRKLTYVGYKSYVKNIREYIATIAPIYYLYQFDKSYASRFLDHIFIERDNGARTRNNYLSWLSVFCGWCVEHNYLQYRPTDGIAYIDKRHIRKNREVIPLPVVKRISEWVKENDPHFLLACQLLYNCFIRPVEMTRLTINMINIKEQTITIPAEASKNHETMVITIPQKVLTTARNLGIFEHEGSCYIFSNRLRPGRTMIDTVVFRHHWDAVRNALKLKKEYQFYSLKDTGITEMLDSKLASITVRDQARHSSLAITELYTRHLGKANKEILNWQGSL